MTEEDFAKAKPSLFHVTPEENLARIVAERTLWSAKELIIRARGTYEASPPRQSAESLQVPDGQVQLRDQLPLLKKGQLVLDGITIEELVELLDSHVYFWPSDNDGLASSTKYANEHLALIRVPTADLFKLNQRPAFCEFNSGGPRATNGKGSRRTRNLFRRAPAFKEPISRVKEIVFHSKAMLPNSAEVRRHGTASFSPLFG